MGWDGGVLEGVTGFFLGVWDGRGCLSGVRRVDERRKVSRYVVVLRYVVFYLLA